MNTRAKAYGILAERMGIALHRAKQQGGWGPACRAQYGVGSADDCPCSAQVAHLFALMEEDRLRADQEWIVRRTLAYADHRNPSETEVQAALRLVRLAPIDLPAAIEAGQEDARYQANQARANQEAQEKYQNQVRSHNGEEPTTPPPKDPGPFGRLRADG
jgi:hypothetical protein